MERVKKPHYELRSLDADGRELDEEPLIFAVEAEDIEVPHINGRRSFLRLGLGTSIAATIAACASGPTVRKNYDPEATSLLGECRVASAVHPGLRQVEFNSDGYLLTAGGTEIKTWEIPSGKLIDSKKIEGSHRLSFHGVPISIPSGHPSTENTDRVALSLSGDYTVGKSFDNFGRPNEFKVYLTDSGEVSHVFDSSQLNDSREEWIGVFVSPGNKYVVCLNGSTRYKAGSTNASFYDMKTGQLVVRHKISNVYLRRAVVKPIDDERFLVLSEGKLLSVGLDQGVLASRDDKVEFVAVTRSRAFEQTVDRELVELDTATLEPKFGVQIDRKLSRNFDDIAASPDGRYLAFSYGSGRVEVWDLQKRAREGCLFDASQLSPWSSINQYRLLEGGVTTTYSIPCGSPIPSGAICTCNCVAAGGLNYERKGSGSGGSRCTCNQVCTCNTVSY